MSYDSTILATSGLVSYWKLNDPSGTTAADSGDSNPATYNGGFTLGGGPPFSGMGGSVAFNGSTGYAEAPTASNLHPTSAVSLECWVKLAALDSNFHEGCGCSNASGSGNFFDYFINFEGTSGSNKPVWNVTAGGTLLQLTGAASVAGNWYHIVGTYDGTTSKLYVNGALVASGAASGAIQNSAQPFAFARYHPSGSLFLNGSMSSVALYSVALTAPQVLLHYEAAQGLTGLFVDGHNSKVFSTATSTSLNLTTAQSNDVIVVMVYSEDGTPTASRRTVSSVTATGLTFQHRATVTGDSGFSSMAEEWYAVASSPLDTASITVTMSGQVDSAVIVAFGVAGCNTASPWDPNGSLPATANAASASPSVSGVSTTNKDDMLLAFMGAANNTASDRTNVPASFTQIDGAGTGAGAFNSEGSAAEQVVSAAQSSISVAWGTMSSPAHAVLIVDALTADATFNGSQFPWADCPQPEPVTTELVTF